MYRFIFKRLLDFTVSIIVLISASPILIIVWVLLLISNNGSGAFFTQYRPGKNGKLFKLIKFKTMNDKKDNQGILLPDKVRITFVGKFIRSLSIDELPQLINVLKGEMSLIGPRPLLSSYLPIYSVEQLRRHEVMPGITGWAQVNGRNAISWEERFKYDIWYVDNLSFWLDIKIIFLTLMKVLKRDGINASESVTMEEFRGNQ